jgi:alpha-glucosidase
MLGNKVLVAPVITKQNMRAVKLPAGQWKTSDGKICKGGRTIQVDVPIDQLLYFRLVG